MKQLSRKEMKLIIGGQKDTGTPGGNNGSACAGCNNLMHRNDNDPDGHIGMCPPETGGTSCHNYCADGYNGGSGYYGWC